MGGACEQTDGGTTPAQVVGELRLDVRLMCAARVFAADLDTNPNDTLIDSGGRETPERLDLAGYAPRDWGEAFAYAADPATAFNFMASGERTCPVLFSESLSDVGVGCVRDACVITLAAEDPRDDPLSAACQPSPLGPATLA
jgi:hypothetical protein